MQHEIANGCLEDIPDKCTMGDETRAVNWVNERGNKDDCRESSERIKAYFHNLGYTMVFQATTYENIMKAHLSGAPLTL